MQPRKPATGFIFITLLLDVLGFGLLIPIGPKLVESVMNGGAGGTEQEASPYVGWLMATYYCLMFLFAPALGVLSDRFGRRPVILISLLGSGLDYFAQAMAPNLSWLFITRAINGLTGASFGVATAYVADIANAERKAEHEAKAKDQPAPGQSATSAASDQNRTDAEQRHDVQRRAAGFGMIYAAFGLGFIFGPVLGGLLGSYGLRYPFYAAGALTIANWLYGYFVLPESLPPELRRPISLARANPVGAWGTLTRYPVVLGMAGYAFLINMAQFALHATWVLYTTHRYNWTAWQTGLSLTVVGVGAAVIQGGFAKRIIPRMGERNALLFGTCMAIAAYTCYGLAPSGWMIYVIVAIASLGGIAQPAGQAIITRTVRPDEQGTVQGAMSSLNSVAGILGPIVGSGVFAYFISDKAPFELPGASFFVSALLSGLALLAALWATRNEPKRGSGSGTPAPAASPAK